MQLSTAELIGQVISRIETTYPDQAETVRETASHISEAITSLSPFEPENDAKMLLNSFLRQRQASKLACMAAWALYKDYFGLQGVRSVRNG